MGRERPIAPRPSPPPLWSVRATPRVHLAAEPAADCDDADCPGGAPLDGPTPEAAPEDGLLYRILKLLQQQPPSSVYLLGLASCVHKWVQASTASPAAVWSRAEPLCIVWSVYALMGQD